MIRVPTIDPLLGLFAFELSLALYLTTRFRFCFFCSHLYLFLQECQRLEAKCEEERGLGQEFAEEAQEWVKLTGRLSDRVNALTAEADQMPKLRKVGGGQTRPGREGNTSLHARCFCVRTAVGLS